MDIILVIPCFNESARLRPEAFRDFVMKNPDISFLFVDDGSQDGTFEILESLRTSHPDNITALRLERNFGKSEAVRRGMVEAGARNPRYAGYWDADLSTPLESVLAFRQYLRDRPEILGVYGARVKMLGRKIDRRAYRHYIGRAFATIVDSLTGLEVYDSQCGAKLFRWGPDIRDVFLMPFVTRWLLDVEILLRLREMGKTVGTVINELPLHDSLHREGSKISYRDFGRVVREVITLHRTYLRKSRRSAW